MKLYMFQAVPVPIIRSLFTVNRHWYVSYRMERSSILVLLESCLQTCMTYTSTEFTVNKLLMMGRGILCQNKFVKLVHLIRFII